jgi:hypothetical protein
MKNRNVEQDELKLTKPVVGLSAFALMLLGASGVGSEALASNVTVTAQASVATPISKTELMTVSKPKPSPAYEHNNHYHNNNTIRHINNIDNHNTHPFGLHGVPFAGSIPRHFDV